MKKNLHHKKRTIITIFSIFTLIFGLTGAAFSFSGIFILRSHEQGFRNIHNFSLSVSSSIQEIDAMLNNLEGTADNIAENLRTTKNIIGHTSTISYESGIAFHEVSEMVGFEILGFRPLGDAESYFSDIGGNLVGLSVELDEAVENLETNVSDVETIGQNLENISSELSQASASFDQAINSFNIYHVYSGIKYLLVYSGMLSIMFILNGIMFFMLRD